MLTHACFIQPKFYSLTQYYDNKSVRVKKVYRYIVTQNRDNQVTLKMLRFRDQINQVTHMWNSLKQIWQTGHVFKNLLLKPIISICYIKINVRYIS